MIIYMIIGIIYTSMYTCVYINTFYIHMSVCNLYIYIYIYTHVYIYYKAPQNTSATIQHGPTNIKLVRLLAGLLKPGRLLVLALPPMISSCKFPECPEVDVLCRQWRRNEDECVGPMRPPRNIGAPCACAGVHAP